MSRASGPTWGRVCAWGSRGGLSSRKVLGSRDVWGSRPGWLSRGCGIEGGVDRAEAQLGGHLGQPPLQLRVLLLQRPPIPVALLQQRLGCLHKAMINFDGWCHQDIGDSHLYSRDGQDVS